MVELNEADPRCACVVVPDRPSTHCAGEAAVGREGPTESA
jgi:hypothetical protein